MNLLLIFQFIFINSFYYTIYISIGRNDWSQDLMGKCVFGNESLSLRDCF